MDSSDDNNLIVRMGDVITDDFVISSDDMAIFAELSGDKNIIHMDKEFARSKGFKDVVVYGALIVAKISKLLGMQVLGRHGLWAGMDVHFHKPLYVGEPASIRAEVVDASTSTGLVQLKLTIRVETRLIARGKIQAVYNG